MWFAASFQYLAMITRKTLPARARHLASRGGQFVALLLGLTSWAVAADPASYVVQDLGVLPGHSSSVAWGINQKGDVVGWSMGADGTSAFLYTDAAGLVKLPGLPDRPRAIARDLNDGGQIVGTANAGGVDLGHAVLWTNGSIKDLGTLGTGSYSEGWAVNNFGQVVGSSYTNGASFGVHGFLFTQARGMVDLTPNSDTGSALDINDAGQVTGYKTATGGNYHAFRWKGGTFVDLGVLSGFAHSFGYAINELGQVAGNSTSASGNSERFFRSISGGGLQNLGGTGEHNVAWGINRLGNVVGTRGSSQSRAVLFTDAGGLRDIGSLIDPSLGWVLLGAHDINDAGQIVGYAFNNYTGKTHAVRLQPATTPPPECTFNCLRSTRIALSAKSQGSNATLTARVTVQDEKGLAMANALVVARWTLPNGTALQANAWTNQTGIAAFVVTGTRPGTYKFQIVNIVLSLHTFNPSQSVLSRSITVQ
jgi:probable HAF family extracellular repeat protein